MTDRCSVCAHLGAVLTQDSEKKWTLDMICKAHDYDAIPDDLGESCRDFCEEAKG